MMGKLLGKAAGSSDEERRRSALCERPPPLPRFAEVRILKELQRGILEVKIIKELRESDCG